MIDDYAKECGGKEKYESLREVLLLLNNLIYIMNGRKNVDCFQVQMMKKLMSYWNLFQLCLEWKDESLSNKKEFIPIQSYKDFC